ncbi:MAG TPA: hypothetical protein VNX26_10285 [Candidatus Acidoferrum sp.]|jgi:hypothetical protein|nr:hypothetical protein [Candidatus Acidoferrum sp.]
MTIEIRDASLEARIRKQLQATGSGSVEEVLLRLLDTQEEQDRWLLENRDGRNEKALHRKPLSTFVGIWRQFEKESSV